MPGRYMFQELLTGGDLFSFVESSGGKLSEDVAATIVRQIIHGVEYLHDQNIVHRDLKPDNILLTRHSPESRVVITDFGHARKVDSSQNRLFSRGVGTYEYAAPYVWCYYFNVLFLLITIANQMHREITGLNAYIDARSGYSKAVDMWSIGAITAMVLTGYMLFSRPSHPDKNPDQERQAFLTYLAHIDNSEEWATVGRRPKAFVKRLLTLNEQHRPTAHQALQHSWFLTPKYRENFERVYSRSVTLWKEYHKCSDRTIVVLDNLGKESEDSDEMQDDLPIPDSSQSEPSCQETLENACCHDTCSRKRSMILGHGDYSS